MLQSKIDKSLARINCKTSVQKKIGSNPQRSYCMLFVLKVLDRFLLNSCCNYLLQSPTGMSLEHKERKTSVQQKPDMSLQHSYCMMFGLKVFGRILMNNWDSYLPQSQTDTSLENKEHKTSVQ